MKKLTIYIVLLPTLLIPAILFFNKGLSADKPTWSIIPAKSDMSYSMETFDVNMEKPPLYSEDLSSEQQAELSAKIVRMQKPNELKVDPLTSLLIEVDLMPKFKNLEFEREPLNIDMVNNPFSYQISSSDDPNYQVFKYPTKSSMQRRVHYAPIVKDDLRILEKIYLALPFELKENHHYSVTLDANLTGMTESMDFVYKSTRISTVIHVDPEGYLPTDKKTAYLGMQLGNIGELVTEELSFSVRNIKTNTIVHNGVGTIEKSLGWRENFSNLDTYYQKVVAFDFSAVTAVGEYVIESPITGVSQPVIIGDDVYRKTLNTLALGIYNQRRGEDIVLPYSRHERLATIENNTYVYDSDDLDPFIENAAKFNGIKYPSDNEGSKVTFEAAGHMDAGDYSIYTYNSALFTWQLLVAVDTYGAKISHDNLGIPESGDGIPDMYQEMMLDLKWLKGMQDNDGGVFGMSKPKGQSYQASMTGMQTNLARYLTPKDTPHTAAFAAVMARSARSSSIQQYNPELVLGLRQQAIKAWEWLEYNHGTDGWHHYGQKEGSDDDRVWAAIELYALTGESKYHDYFVAHHEPELRYNGVDWFNYGYGYANRVVALWDREAIPYALDEEMKSRSITRYKQMLDHYLDLASSTPYNILIEVAAKRWNQLGWHFPLFAYGYDLVLGHFLYGDERYLDLAKDQLHFSLGANPSNQSSITGLGNKRIQSLVDQKSRFDTLAQPVNGLAVAPIVTGSSWLNGYEYALTDYTYPKTTYDFSEGMAYGLLDETYDGWNVSAEFTIEKLAAMLVVAGYITDVETENYVYPEFTLAMRVLENGRFEPQLNFKNEPEGGKVVWYANDIPISIDPNFILEQNFDVATYKLGAEIIDNNGRRWFTEVLVNTRDYNNSDIPLEPTISSDLAHVWHFDNNLSSDKGIGLTFKGDTYLDDSNLFWMKEPSGKAIRVNGKNSGVETTIIMSDLVGDKDINEVDNITIEALIYLESFVDVGELGEMLKFSQSWGSQLQLVHYKWNQDLLTTRLSRSELGDDSKINDALVFNSWHHIKMKIDKERIYFSLDGKELYNQERTIDATVLFNESPIEVYLGDFNGWIDEFRVVANERDFNSSKVPFEPFEPFESETYAQIWHFDNGLASDKGIELTFKNDAQLNNENLSWMKLSQGNGIYFNGKASAVESKFFMTDLIGNGNLHDVNSMTVEALIYPEEFLAEGEIGDMIKVSQSWDSQLQLVHYSWNKNLLTTRLSRTELGNDYKINDALTLNSWHHIKMKIDKERIYFSIDGQEVYNQARTVETTKLFDHREIEVYLGDFRGWIDEFRIKVEMEVVVESQSLIVQENKAIKGKKLGLIKQGKLIL